MNKFNRAYELRSKVLQRLSRLFVSGKITVKQYNKRVQNSNLYVLKRGAKL